MRAHVAFNRPISAAYRHLGIVTPGFPQVFGPGQFVMVRPSLSVDPFLPRAFSIYRIAPSADRAGPVIEILYKVLGKGTQCLSRTEAGQEVEILGPLGNNFTVGASIDTAVLVAGGIGVPPIAALARTLAASRDSYTVSRQPSAFRTQSESRTPNPEPQTADVGPRTSDPEHRPPRIVVLLGGKTSEDILCAKDFESVEAAVHITTEDGSLGTRGLITDVLGPFLESVGDQAIRQSGNQEKPNRPIAQSPSCLCIFTCGPPGMLAAVARLAEHFGVMCQTSVEANMACGFGACMGCAIEVQGNGSGPKYKLVCKDGPVFDSRELVWR